MPDPSPAPPLLQAIGLRRAQRGPYDLEVRASTTICLSGPSGSGKSLLLRMIADLDAHQGEVLLSGQRRSTTSGPAWRRSVTYVAAHPAFWATRVHEHFATDIELGPLLASIGLPEEASQWPIARLSTGERARIALVRAIAQRPAVLLLDEPTSGLDVDTTGAVEQLLDTERSRGVGIVLVTHDLRQIERLAHRHLHMSADGVLQESP